MVGTSPGPRGYGPLIVLVVLFLGVGALALLVPSGSAVHRVALVLWGAIPIAAALWEYAYRRIEAHRRAVREFQGGKFIRECAQRRTQARRNSRAAQALIGIRGSCQAAWRRKSAAPPASCREMKSCDTSHRRSTSPRLSSSALPRAT